MWQIITIIKKNQNKVIYQYFAKLKQHRFLRAKVGKRFHSTCTYHRIHLKLSVLHCFKSIVYYQTQRNTLETVACVRANIALFRVHRKKE